ncbi:MAG: HAMP domain-containing histidine kinase [Planctomycetes bacterium]|nr:HAMP domain-containing histidine kinase [Planctomycetota bacterium]
MNTYDPVTFDVLQANVDLLAENERLDLERRRLLELDQLKTEFLARISHDLRTPLNSIIGFSDLITSEVGGRINKKHAEFIAAINRNGHALLAMINELLDLSSLESGHVQLRLDQVPLQVLLEDLQDATVPVLENAGIETRWPQVNSVKDKTVLVDRRRIVQVLVNLVDNARKFTPRGGVVSVEMDRDSHGVHLVVADNGPGIPKSEQDRIFAPYYQRPSGGMATNAHGVGLGLAIVKSIVDRHGGSIELDSGIGKGCRFKVLLPDLSRAEQKTSDPVPAAAPDRRR